MSSQSLLLPSDSSLFITDKSWLRPVRGYKPGQSNFQLDERSGIDGLSVTVVKTSIKTAHVTKESSETRGLQFVNSTQKRRGKKVDAELRKLVRSHVMTGTSRKTSKKSSRRSGDPIETRLLQPNPDTTNETDIDEQVISPHSTSSWPSKISSDMIQFPTGTSISFYGITNLTIQPYFHRFINFYTQETAAYMYPLQAYLGFNPVKSFWFPKALTDEVLLYTIMYSAASALAQIDSRISSDMNRLVGPIFQLLTSRLSDRTYINDTAIAAVSCLMMIENMFNNREKYRIHKNGLQQMVKARGGLAMIDSNLVLKIIRADVEGSVDMLRRPMLPPLARQAPTLFSTLPADATELPPKIVDILQRPELRDELKAALLELSNFAIAMKCYTHPEHNLYMAINPRSFDEDLLSIARSLLELESLNMIEEILQVAALIFMKSIGRELPFAATSSQLLPKRLKQALNLSLSFDLIPISKPILEWLLVMGGLASTEGTSEHAWFADELRRLNCPDVMKLAKEVLFVEAVHEQPCQRFLAQVEALRDSGTN